MFSINKNKHDYHDEYEISEPLLPTVKAIKICKHSKRKCTVCFPVRFSLILWIFSGLFICYALRANLSVAILAMVKSVDSNIFNGTRNSTCFSINYSNSSTNDTPKIGEFDWNESTQGMILSSFFYGYVLTNVPGGLLSQKYGGKWIFGIGILITSFATLLTPIAARLNIAALICARFLAGLGEGVTFPAYYTLFSRWIPKQERSFSVALANCGANIGTIVAMPATAWLCDNGFSGGWPSVFYIFGGVGCLWFVLWVLCTQDKPELSSCISKKELAYILENRDSEKSSIEIKSIPWKKICSSTPVFALALTKFSGMWTLYTMLTELPSYMHSVLNYNMKENGALNSIVFTSLAIMTIISGLTSDFIRSKKWISISALRKSYQSFATFGPALLLFAITLVGCDAQAVTLILIFTMASVGFTAGGESPTSLDMSAEYVGIVFGICNCLGNAAGLLTPLITGFITQGNDPLKSWNHVFYLASAINVMGGIAFLAFGSAKKQSWSHIS